MEVKLKHIFWLEEDPGFLVDYFERLNRTYKVVMGAHWDLLEEHRRYDFDLLLLDLMIHISSIDYNSNEEVKNIHFPDIDWTRTGVEFLRRLRKGEYKHYGFPKSIPVIVATAVSTTREDVEQLGINDYIEKPFSIETLEDSIKKAFEPSIV